MAMRAASTTPDANYSGSDSFTYNISDGNGGVDQGTVSITVTHVNQAPTANPDSKTLLENAGSTPIDVLANDTDPDGDTLTVTGVSNPPHGTATVDGDAGGVHYTPDANYSGSDSFTYNISDGNGGVDRAPSRSGHPREPGPDGQPRAPDPARATRAARRFRRPRLGQ